MVKVETDFKRVSTIHWVIWCYFTCIILYFVLIITILYPMCCTFDVVALPHFKIQTKVKQTFLNIGVTLFSNRFRVVWMFDCVPGILISKQLQRRFQFWTKDEWIHLRARSLTSLQIISAFFSNHKIRLLCLVSTTELFVTIKQNVTTLSICKFVYLVRETNSPITM